MSDEPDLWPVTGPDESACDLCGRESCEGNCSKAKSSSPPQLRMRTAAEVMHEPPPVAIIDGIINVGGVFVLVSESGAGKSFVALSMASAVTAGLPWMGRRTREGSVVYVAFEKDALGKRLRALRQAQGARLDHLYVLRPTEPLSPRVLRDGSEEPSIGERTARYELEALAQTLAATRLPPIVLIVIDTVRASMTGSEDSSEHVAAYLRSIRRVGAEVPGAGLLLNHHAGWQDGDTKRQRERGSSAWRGNVDGTLYLETDGEYDRERGIRRLVLHDRKSRDDESAPPLALLRRRVELTESDGRSFEPVTSCVIERDPRTAADREADEQRAAADVARELDLRILRLVAERPDLTSQAKIRETLNLGSVVVREAFGRLLCKAWLTPPSRQREPYSVTDAGRAALAESAASREPGSRTESD